MTPGHTPIKQINPTNPPRADFLYPENSMAIPKKKLDRSAGTGAAVFRDTLYTSRTLILADGRELSVTQGAVSVPVGDTLARDYLEQHPHFQPQE